MVGTEQDQDALRSTHAWQRWGWIWAFLFYAVLGLNTLLWLLSSERNASPAIPVLLLAAAILHPLFHHLLPPGRQPLRHHGRLGLAYTLLLTGLILALISISPVFFFLLAGYFGQIFYTLPSRQAIPLALFATVLFGAVSLESRSIPELIRQPLFWIWIVGGGAGSLIAFWIEAIVHQSHERQELIQQLTETRTELAAAEREAGILSERERLSREIHDTLAQGFISIVTHLEAADAALETWPPDDGVLERLRYHLERARETARHNLHEARRVVEELRPELLEDGSLPHALARLAQRWSKTEPIQVQTSVHGAVQPLPLEIEVSLLRIVQEALTNIVRHSEAGRADITLSYLPDELILDIQDDGIGIDASRSRGEHGGFGLRSMRERIESVGGELTIESDGQGTTISARLPLILQNNGTVIGALAS